MQLPYHLGLFMPLLFKVAALIFAGLDFLAYGWWDRSYLGFFEKIFWLSPAICLLTVGLMPLKVLSSRVVKILFTAFAAIAVLRTVQSIVQALGSPIEPDTPAAILSGIVLALLVLGIALAWHPISRSNSTTK